VHDRFPPTDEVFEVSREFEGKRETPRNEFSRGQKFPPQGKFEQSQKDVVNSLQKIKVNALPLCLNSVSFAPSSRLVMSGTSPPFASIAMEVLTGERRNAISHQAKFRGKRKLKLPLGKG